MDSKRPAPRAGQSRRNRRCLLHAPCASADALRKPRSASIRQGRYPYSEQVEPWFRRWVEQGDRDRRIAQDLLFATESERWMKALERLTRRERRIVKAVETAEIVHGAIATRDQVLSGSFPYYGRSLARRPNADDDRLRGDSSFGATFINRSVRWNPPRRRPPTPRVIQSLTIKDRRASRMVSACAARPRSARPSMTPRTHARPQRSSLRAAEAHLQVPFFDRDPGAPRGGRPAVQLEWGCDHRNWRSPETGTVVPPEDVSSTRGRRRGAGHARGASPSPRSVAAGSSNRSRLRDR